VLPCKRSEAQGAAARTNEQAILLCRGVGLVGQGLKGLQQLRALLLQGLRYCSSVLHALLVHLRVERCSALL